MASFAFAACVSMDNKAHIPIATARGKWLGVVARYGR
jgi:hypothetical protein